MALMHCPLAAVSAKAAVSRACQPAALADARRAASRLSGGVGMARRSGWRAAQSVRADAARRTVYQGVERIIAMSTLSQQLPAARESAAALVARLRAAFDS